jgi:cryptochrome
MNSSVLWFRHGLRLHDNPALLSAIDNTKTGGEDRVQLFPVFIFDGESASKLKNIIM